MGGVGWGGKPAHICFWECILAVWGMVPNSPGVCIPSSGAVGRNACSKTRAETHPGLSALSILARLAIILAPFLISNWEAVPRKAKRFPAARQARPIARYPGGARGIKDKTRANAAVY